MYLYVYLSLCGWTEVAEILNREKTQDNNRGWENVLCMCVHIAFQRTKARTKTQSKKIVLRKWNKRSFENSVN